MSVEYRPVASVAMPLQARRAVTRFLAGVALACLVCAACGSEVTGPDVGLPNRTEAANVSGVTLQFRQVGGNAFVRLTGFPTPQSIAALSHAGLKPPADCERISGTPCTVIMTFDGLALHAVWGNIPAHGLDRLVALKFVTAIEPSADIITSVSGQH